MLKGGPLATERMLQIDNDVLRGASAVTVASAFEAGHPGMRKEETMAVLLDLARNGAVTDRDAERGWGQGDDFGPPPLAAIASARAPVHAGSFLSLLVIFRRLREVVGGFWGEASCKRQP